MGGLDLTHCPRALRLPAGWRLNRSKLYPARDESGLEVLLRKTVGPLTGFSPKADVERRGMVRYPESR